MKKWIALFLVAAIALPGIRYGWLEYVTKETITVTVTDKERVADQDQGTGKYLICTSETTYEMTDTWFYWRFDTSDEYGKLVKGDDYKITTVGIRLGFLSWYPNIVAFERLKKEKGA